MCRQNKEVIKVNVNIVVGCILSIMGTVGFMYLAYQFWKAWNK